MYFSIQFHLKIRKMSSECALGPGLKNTEAKKKKKKKKPLKQGCN